MDRLGPIKWSQDLASACLTDKLCDHKCMSLLRSRHSLWHLPVSSRRIPLFRCWWRFAFCPFLLTSHWQWGAGRLRTWRVAHCCWPGNITDDAAWQHMATPSEDTWLQFLLSNSFISRLHINHQLSTQLDLLHSPGISGRCVFSRCCWRFICLPHQP